MCASTHWKWILFRMKVLNEASYNLYKNYFDPQTDVDVFEKKRISLYISFICSSIKYNHFMPKNVLRIHSNPKFMTLSISLIHVKCKWYIDIYHLDWFIKNELSSSREVEWRYIKSLISLLFKIHKIMTRDDKQFNIYMARQCLIINYIFITEHKYLANID
jgi:hypothetical protein